MTPAYLLHAVLLLAAGADPTIATVNGRPITAGRLEAYVAESAAAGRSAPAQLLADELVQQELAAGEAARVGIPAEPAVQGAVEARARSLAAQRHLERDVLAAVKPDEATIRELYHARADAVRYRIVVKPTRDDARAVLARLQGGARFADEAKGSLDPGSAPRGGEIAATRGSVEPRLAPVVFAAPLHALAGPVELDLGWGVVEVLERQLGDDAGYAAARPATAAMAEQILKSQMRSHYLKGLAASAKAELDLAFLEGTGPRLDATDAEREQVVARVGPRALRYGEVLEETHRIARGRANRHFSGARVKIELARARLDELLLEDAAERRGYLKDPEIVTAAALFERQLSARTWVAREAQKAPPPSAADAEAWYARHGAEWSRPGRRTCSHLVLGSEKEARELRGRIARGVRFEDVAELSRDTATASRGGLLGDLPDGRVAELAKTEPGLARAIQSSIAGEISDPVRSAAGWHLVRCGPHQPAGPPPFAEVAKDVTERIRKERGEARVDEAIARLRSAARITIDRDAVARLAGPAVSSR